ncbi:membrane protein [Micrococcales bacterium KH10]|nr:membrane protein [Micrococcales bacterium KH10]
MTKGLGRVLAFVKGVLQWWKASRGGRTMDRYNQAAGALLCGGIAYTAVFSIFAALVIGYTTVTMIVGNNDELKDQMLSGVDQFIPGLVDTGSGGALTPEQLMLTTGRGLTSIIAAAVLLWSAISFMGGLRTAVQTVLHTEPVSENAVIGKLKDLGGYVVLFAAVLLTSALSWTMSLAGSWLSERLGSTALTTAANVVGIALIIIVDIAVFSYVMVVLGRVKPKRKDLIIAGFAVGLVIEALRLAGTQIVTGSASKNALLASFAVIVTLLLVVNLVARVALMAAAWLAEGEITKISGSSPSKPAKSTSAQQYAEGPVATLPKQT